MTLGFLLGLAFSARYLCAPSHTRIIAEALNRDPIAAASEWNAEWRGDIDGFMDREAIEALVIPGRRELPRESGVIYTAFCDPSGGSSDSFTLAVAHRSKDGRAILDCVRERRPPFSPDNVVGEFAVVLKSYGLSTVVGDSYSAEWCRERFRVHGITYQPSDLNKSQIYLAFLPIANSGMAEILDNTKLVTQSGT